MSSLSRFQDSAPNEALASKGALLLDAAVAGHRMDVMRPIDTGTLTGDLSRFLAATFARASVPGVASLLRATMREAQGDPDALRLLQDFAARRRAALRELFVRAQRRGEIADGAAIDLAVDQAFGFLWYRVLMAHTPLSRDDARALAAGLSAQLQGP